VPSFTCAECGSAFDLPQHVLDRYPGWTPSKCRDCRGKEGSRSKSPSKASHTEPDGNAVYTDGGCEPNPGPGGWAAVWVRDEQVVEERSGHDPDTTNNRMELLALIEAVKMLPEGTTATIFSDSNLAVQTINEWAQGWKARGWKRKTGPVQNLDLVQELYELFESRPELTLEWIKAHAGHRWNERADELTRAWKG
jgi:ribonuclease HI